MPRRRSSTLQQLLSEERLRALNVNTEDGHRTIRADLLIGDRLAAILRTGGRALYAEFDRQAPALLERGKTENDPRLLEEVEQSYPVARAVPEALLTLGALSERAQRPAEAAHAYKRLLAACGRRPAPRPGPLGTRPGLRGAAPLGAGTRRLRRGPHPVPGQVVLEPGAPLGRLVGERLALRTVRPDDERPYRSRTSRSRWSGNGSGRWTPWCGRSRPTEFRRRPRRAGSSSCKGPRSARWIPPRGCRSGRADLGQPPVWVGYLADKIIAATPSRLVALDLEKGSPQWRYDLGTPESGRRGTNPFARAEPRRTRARPARHGSMTSGSSGDASSASAATRDLIAFDGDTGLVDWSFSPPAGTINPNLWIGPQRIVLQVRSRTRSSSSRPATAAAAPSIPKAMTTNGRGPPCRSTTTTWRWCLDRRTVALFDLRRGVTSWNFRESLELPKHGAPRLLGNAERLLVIHDGYERDPPRPGHRQEALERPAAARLRGPERAARSDGARRRAVLLGQRPDASRARPWPTGRSSGRAT